MMGVDTRHGLWKTVAVAATCLAVSILGPSAQAMVPPAPPLPCSTPRLEGSLGATIWAYQEDLSKQQQSGDTAAEAADWCALLRLLQGATGTNNWTADALYWKGLGHYWLSNGEYTAAVGAFDQEAAYWSLAGEPTWGDADEIIANSYRSVLQVYMQDNAPGSIGVQGMYAPSAGTLIGYYVQGDSAVGNYPTAARISAAYDGRMPAILLYYVVWGQTVPTSYITAAKSMNAALEIALQPEQGLAEVLSSNAYLQRLATQLASAGLPVFLRFANEMNGNWVPWGMLPVPGSATFQAQAQQYVAAFREVATVMHSMAPNVAMVWAPNDIPTTGTEAYWPGSAYVDWVGVSAYLDYSVPGSVGADARQSLLANLSWIYDHYASKKPIMIAEGGIAHYDDVGSQDVTSWGIEQMNAFLTGLPLLYPDIKAVVWWSADKSGVSDYTLSNDPSFLHQFVADTSSPWYLSSIGASSPVRSTPLEGATVQSTVQIESYVHDWHLRPARVVYSVDGGPGVTAASSPPYVVSLSGLAPGAHTLTVDAYGPGGHIDATTTVPFTVAGFTDLGGYAWAAPDIRTLAAEGIINGVSPTEYDPGAPVTREQFAALISRAFHLSPSAGATFSDVPSTSWAYQDIQAAGDLIPPVSSLFHPTDPITREDMAAALGALLMQTKQMAAVSSPASVLNAFQDASSIPPAIQGDVAVAVQAGIIQGLPGGYFEPQQPLTRAQAAVVLARALRVPAGAPLP